MAGAKRFGLNLFVHGDVTTRAQVLMVLKRFTEDIKNGANRSEITGDGFNASCSLRSNERESEEDPDRAL